MKKAILIVFSLCSSISLIYGQVFSDDHSTTRAVIVGISDYQSESIPDLNFAHRDAQIFADYLKSLAGGSVAEEHIKLLINADATMASLAAELDWLVEESKEGDKAIVYFSGHGDVESKTARQPGFLLTYDSPAKIYIAGAYPLFYLQLIIETLSVDKNVETIVITDACRSGKLAGSEIGGTQATASNLAKQYGNEVKILSCQPDELSMEGTQWGDGRGAFSYHLIEGLMGLADNNENAQVNLLEIENYLEDIVPQETAPQSQIPMAIGRKGTNLAMVDKPTLLALEAQKERQLPTMAAVDSRAIDEFIPAQSDSLLLKKYNAFLAALDNGYLLESPTQESSADDLYRALIKEQTLEKVHRSMTRSFAAKLQDEAQQAINAYLLTTPGELTKRWSGDKAYSKYPRYLDRAAELLTDKHYMYDYLIAKRLYFEGLNIRLQADKEEKNYQKAIELQSKAIDLEDRAAYFYNELGVLYSRTREGDKAKDNYQKAIELAPEWGLPYTNLCLEHFYNNEYPEAIRIGKRALELIPDFPELYNLLGWINMNQVVGRDKSNWKREGIELQGNFYYGNFEGLNESQKERALETIDLLHKAIEIDSTYTTGFLNLAGVYSLFDNHSMFLALIDRAIQIDTTDGEPYSYKGDYLYWHGQRQQGIKYMRKAAELSVAKDKEKAAFWYINLGGMYQGLSEDKNAADALKKALQNKQNMAFAIDKLALIHLKYGERNKAETTFLSYREELHSQNPVYYITRSGPNYYSTLAKFYMDLNRFEDAELILKKAVEMDSGYYKPKFDLADLYIKKNQRHRAIEIIDEIEKDSALLADPTLTLGIYNYLCGRKLRAEKLFERAIELSLNHTKITNEVGFFYRLNSEPDKAEKYLNMGRNHKKTNKEYVNLAWVYFEKNDLDKTQNILDQALRSEPKNDHLKYLKAIFYIYGENIESANKILDELVTFNPNYEYLKQAVNAAFLDHNYVLADSSFQKAMRGLPDDNIPYLYARFKTQSENYEEALDLLNIALKAHGRTFNFMYNDPNLTPLKKFPKYQVMLRQTYPSHFDDLEQFEFVFDSPIYYPENLIPLARFYERNLNRERALELYQKLIALEPDHQLAKQLHSVVSYQDNYENTKHLFEGRGLLFVWESLEAMRLNQFKKADKTWKDLQDNYSGDWLDYVKYQYAQMKVREGKQEEAFQLLEQIIENGVIVNYRLLESDQGWNSIKDLPRFAKILKSCLPPE